MSRWAYGFLIVAVGLVLSGSTGLAFQACGWEEIRQALLDGNASEFIVNAAYPVSLSGETEFERVMAAANWVASHITYAPDDPECGDVWVSADEVFRRRRGDCEDFAILLCALIRYVVGVPASRVWVQAGLVAVPQDPSKPPLAGHAYVVYRSEQGGVWYVEPQWGGTPYRGSSAIVGESAMLRFNDSWVTGGGIFLAGPRNGDQAQQARGAGKGMARCPAGESSSPNRCAADTIPQPNVPVLKDLPCPDMPSSTPGGKGMIEKVEAVGGPPCGEVGGGVGGAGALPGVVPLAEEDEERVPGPSRGRKP